MYLSSAFIGMQLQRIIMNSGNGGTLQYWLSAIFLNILVVFFTSVLAWFIVFLGFPSPETLGVLFVIPVLFSAILYGLTLSLLASIISTLAYNFVLLPPIWQVVLWEPENFAKFEVLAIVALVTSALASRIKKLAQESLIRESLLKGVHDLSQDMLGIANPQDMIKAAENKLSLLSGFKAKIILKESLVKKSSSSDKALQACIANNLPTGYGSDTFTSEINLYLPLFGVTKSVIGAVCLENVNNPQILKDKFSSRVLATLAAQTASALEKARLYEAHEKELLTNGRDKFFSALLSSVSHDFKTPLVTVIGTLTSLKNIKNSDDSRIKDQMITSALEEAQKLNRFISNLMEISRIESGIENIKKEPVLLADMLASAIKSLNLLISNQKFIITIEENFPLLNVNSSLMELVFLNLLDNSIKYGPKNGEIKIIANYDGKNAIIDIDDDGDGIPQEERESVFIKFYRASKGDSKIAGTGLGLYICKCIIQAHNGQILAIDPHDGKGACMRVKLPSDALIAIDRTKPME